MIVMMLIMYAYYCCYAELLCMMHIDAYYDRYDAYYIDTIVVMHITVMAHVMAHIDAYSGYFCLCLLFMHIVVVVHLICMMHIDAYYDCYDAYAYAYYCCFAYYL